jgi:hypothetical protein
MDLNGYAVHCLNALDPGGGTALTDKAACAIAIRFAGLSPLLLGRREFEEFLKLPAQFRDSSFGGGLKLPTHLGRRLRECAHTAHSTIRAEARGRFILQL